MTNSVLAAALGYAEQGFPVLPLRPNGKTPTTQHGYLDATVDPDHIGEMFDRRPIPNLGIRTGEQSDLLVIDVDNKNGIDGNASWQELTQGIELPETLVVETPNNGSHYYFRLCPGQQLGCPTGILPGIDIRGNGGYVVAPPSNIDGAAYVCINPEADIAPLPATLYQRIEERMRSTRARLDASVANGQIGLRVGTRNDSVFRILSRMRGQGVSYEQARLEAIRMASACEDPLSFPLEEALQCVDSAYRYPPNFECTETGLARRFAEVHSEQVRYCSDESRWSFYDESEQIWVCEDHGVRLRLLDCIDQLRDEIASARNESRQSELRAFSRNAQRHATQQSVLSIAKSLPSIRVTSDAFDNDPEVFAVANGVINLNTGGFLSPTPGQMIRTRSLVGYDGTATCSRFLEFLTETTGGDSDLARFIQKAVGYTMLGDNRGQVMFLLFGDGLNGKSVLLRIVSRLFGGYAVAGPPEMLALRQRDQTNDLARLVGKRFLCLSEVSQNRKLDETLVKQMTGGDPIAARALYREFRDISNGSTPWLATNHLPSIDGTDYAIWRRIRVIPFLHTVPEHCVNPALFDSICEELPGVLNWAIEGYRLWTEENLDGCAAVERATRAYRDSQDAFDAWLNQSICAGQEYTPLAPLYNSYRGFLDPGDIQLSRTAFSRALERRGFQKVRESHGMSFRVSFVRRRRRRLKRST